LLLRLFFFILLIFFLLSLLKSRLTRAVRRSRRPSTKEAEEMEFDPQCQSYVPKREAIEAGGHYFCSRECADRFLAKHHN
jgi:YHS domain-containing protein